MFSKLSKNKKTYNIIIQYLKFFNDDNLKKDLIHFENDLQVQEIKNYLKNNNISKNDETEKNKWIEQKCKKYREFLNSCKYLASTIKMDRTFTDREYIYSMITYYNKCVYPFINTIF
jgi:hypothetical protein